MSPAAYSEVLQLCAGSLKEEQQFSESVLLSIREIRQLSLAIAQITGVSLDDREGIVTEIKSRLWRLHQSDELIRHAMENSLRTLNGIPGDASSFDRLDALLKRQSYRLAHWRLAPTEINYRRFFDINDLVGLRVEDPLVFAARHAEIMRLIQEGKVAGLRVDHIDGLLDPWEYLERLRSIPGSQRDKDSSDASILYNRGEDHVWEESLPSEWACCGTTGYDFLNAVNALFVNRDGYFRIEEAYRRFAGITEPFAEAWYERRNWLLNSCL